MTANARILKADGTERPTAPLDSKRFTLEEMQQIVGGYIEVLLVGYLPDSNGTAMVMIANEEGRIKRLPVNDKATELYWEGRGSPGDMVVGDVLICREDQLS